MGKLKYSIYIHEEVDVMKPAYSLYDDSISIQGNIKLLEFQAGYFDSQEEAIEYLEDKNHTYRQKGEYLIIPVYTFED